MTTDRSRQLAAIMFADIVGYTKLSASHEEAALVVVDEFQAASRETVQAHGGRIVKFLGDAVLMVFESADAAIKAALALQRAFHAAPTANQYGSELTFGIHLGEVVEAEDGDVYGDGVNVASRVQGKASAGQILTTRSVADLIRGRSEFNLQPVATWVRLRGVGLARLFVVTAAGERPPPRRVAMSRAMAVGISAGLVAFIGLIIAVGFRDGGGGATPEAPTEAELTIDPAVELDIGVEHYFAGELQRAVHRLAPFVQSPLRELPEAGPALRYLARAHLELDQDELARAALEQLVNSEPPMELLIPSAESESLIDLYYDVRTDARRPATGTPVEAIIVFDLRFAADTNDPALSQAGPSVSLMLVTELEDKDVPVRYPWEVMVGYTGELAYRRFEERILSVGDVRVTHAMFGRLAIRDDQVSISGRIYEMATGGLVVSETVTGVWPDSLLDLVVQLGEALGRELREAAP